MSTNPQISNRIHPLNLQWRLVKPWLGVASLVGLGFLPCPECGAPMIIHFWPIAAVVALRNWVRRKKQVAAQFDSSETSISTENKTELSKNLAIRVK